jgi:hypothetical protein
MTEQNSDVPDPATATVAEVQDLYLAKSCLRCHLNDFGENKFTGDFRSSGCTACHMNYADDGLSKSDDPRINKETVPHPLKHEITGAVSLEQCTHCHYRGGRIGMSYQGYRESGGGGYNPPNPEVLGIAQHGHDAAYYLTDENVDNDFDETPPDVHFEAGMTCIDCHTEQEVHGDGHLYADTMCVVKTECTDCHGTVRERAQLSDARPNLFEEDGYFWLRKKTDGEVLPVSQVVDLVTPGNPLHSPEAERSMGVDANGFSHADEVECYTCHAGWSPSCYGCHIEVDFDRSARFQSTGVVTPGAPSGSRRFVVLNDLVLMRNSDGLLAPSMPAERFFLTVRHEGAVTSVNSKPRTHVTEDDRTIAGFGQRPFNPHTTRRRSQFMACDRCHSVGSEAAPTNEALLDVTHGFGTERFPFTACDVTNVDNSCGENDQTTYQMDAILNRAGESLVAVGHDEPAVSRVLTLDEISRMRAVVVDVDEPIRTAPPPDGGPDPTWPYAQPFD